MHGTFPPTPTRRIIRRDDSWTYREIEALRKYWPDMAALLTLLPHRTETSIRGMAQKCRVIPPKDQHIWTAAEDKRLRAMASRGATRKEMAEQLGLSLLQTANRLQYAGIRLPKRPPAPCRNELADSVRLRAFQMNITMRDLDRSLGNQQIFQNAVTNRWVDTKHIVKAVKALGGRLTIVWDEL